MENEKADGGFLGGVSRKIIKYSIQKRLNFNQNRQCRQNCQKKFKKGIDLVVPSNFILFIAGTILGAFITKNDTEFKKKSGIGSLIIMHGKISKLIKIVSLVLAVLLFMSLNPVSNTTASTVYIPPGELTEQADVKPLETVSLVSSEVWKTSARLDTEFKMDGEAFASGSFEISDDGGATWMVVGGTFDGGNGTGTCTGYAGLTELTPNTKYKYRVSVACETGDILISDANEFVTLPSIVGGSTAPGTDPGKVAVSAHFTGGKEALVARIYWDTDIIDAGDPSSWATVHSVALTDGEFNSSGISSFNVDGLPADSAYHFLIVVGNEAGWDVHGLRYDGVTNVTISNSVAGGNAGDKKDFRFTVSFMDNHGDSIGAGKCYAYVGGTVSGTGAESPKSGTLNTDAAGQAAFSLKHGQEITIKNLPVGSRIRVKEDSYRGYTAVCTDSADPFASNPVGGTGDELLRASSIRVFSFENAKTGVVASGLNGEQGNIALLRVGMAILAMAIAALITVEIKRRKRWAK